MILVQTIKQALARRNRKSSTDWMKNRDLFQMIEQIAEQKQAKQKEKLSQNITIIQKSK